jgi:hypothetical protein
MSALTPAGRSCSLEPSQVGSVERALVLKCDRLIDELFVGYVGEWDLLRGDLIEHKVYDDAVYYIALSGDMIVANGDNECIRVFNVSTCWLLLSSFSYL